MAATKIIARFNMIDRAEYESIQALAETTRRLEPNNPAGYPDRYNSRTAYDLEQELRRGWKSVEQLRAEYAERLPGLTIEVTEGHLEGLVLSTEYRSTRVMSDVWENLLFVKVWHDGKIVEVGEGGSLKSEFVGNEMVHTYLPGLDVPQSNYADVGGVGVRSVVRWTTDATEEVKEAAAVWQAKANRVRAEARAGQAFLADVEATVVSAKRLDQTSLARVVKGRKAPLGDGYQVTYIGNGQYGPYANIRHKDGRLFRYISTGNLEATPDWAKVFDGFALVWHEQREPDAQLCGLLAGVYDSGDLSRWNIVLDRYEELTTSEAAAEVRRVLTHRGVI